MNTSSTKLIFSSFEDFLRDEHAGSYMGTDDDMPEAFEKWLVDLDTERLIAMADNFASHQSVEVKNKIVRFIETLN